VALVACFFSRASAASTRWSSGIAAATSALDRVVVPFLAAPAVFIGNGFYSGTWPVRFGVRFAELRLEVALRIAAIVLIVLGVVALLYGGITYTSREKVLDIGPIEATTETQKTIPLPPLFGAAAIVGGIALYVAAGRKR
jgi:hypothetical protein